MRLGARKVVIPARTSWPFMWSRTFTTVNMAPIPMDPLISGIQAGGWMGPPAVPLTTESWLWM